MAAPPKVYEMIVMARAEWRDRLHVERHGTQVRVAVAAASKAAACRAFTAAGCHVSVRDMNAYGGETGNPHTIAAAMSDPGAVFFATLDGRADREWLKADPPPVQGIRPSDLVTIADECQP